MPFLNRFGGSLKFNVFGRGPHAHVCSKTVSFLRRIPNNFLAPLLNVFPGGPLHDKRIQKHMLFLEEKNKNKNSFFPKQDPNSWPKKTVLRLHLKSQISSNIQTAGIRKQKVLRLHTESTYNKQHPNSLQKKAGRNGPA